MEILPEGSCCKNHVFTAEKAIFKQNKPSGRARLIAPHSGVFSNQFVEKLQRIGNLGESRI